MRQIKTTALQEMDLTEKNLKVELDNTIAALDDRQSGKSGELLVDSTVKAQEDTEASESDLLGKLENKKKELVCCIFLILVMLF